MPDITTPLLARITQESLDEDYQHVADRRAAAGGRRPSSRRTRLVATVVVGAFGLLVAVAAVQTDEQSGVESASRASLIDQITAERERLADLQARTVSLRELNVGLEESSDETNDKANAAEVRAQRLAAQTGFAPVTGPGIRVTVDDAPDGELVRADDLAKLVDGLWNAGAEAISINGKRMTARSALYNTGVAINLNGPPPLSPPYVVSAIGDEDTLQADLLDTSSGLAFFSLADSLGFPVDVDNVDELALPAAGPRMLRLPTIDAAADAQSTKNRKETTQ